MSAPDKLGRELLPAPDQLGSDKLSLSFKLGRELLPETAVFAWLSTLCAPFCVLSASESCVITVLPQEANQQNLKKTVIIHRKTIEPTKTLSS
jgi:hypothetical protein